VTEHAAVVNEVWVLDAMCVSHFARADRLDVLRDLLVGKECWTTMALRLMRQPGPVSAPGMRRMPGPGCGSRRVRAGTM
jgi:hypothetical protein